MARGGVGGFFNGATPSIMRAFVVSGSRFSVGLLCTSRVQSTLSLKAPGFNP
jgi:hypothetical protein